MHLHFFLWIVKMCLVQAFNYYCEYCSFVNIGMKSEKNRIKRFVKTVGGNFEAQKIITFFSLLV